MASESWSSSWANAVGLYDSLSGPAWGHIGPFREMVAALAKTDAAAGLTAATSMHTLVVSPYTRHPDWIEGRHVLVEPLRDGNVRIESHEEGATRRPTNTWMVPVEEAQEVLERLIGQL